MADWTSTLADWSTRSAGAIAGSSVSLVYFFPKARREAVSRLIVGMISGLIFAPSVGEKLVEWMALKVPLDEFEVLLMGAAAASFTSWWALGFAVRILERSLIAHEQKALGAAQNELKKRKAPDGQQG